MNESLINKYIQRTMYLGKRAEGKTSPNPMVGAILVKNGKIIAEGYHHRAGCSHAEIEALNIAGKNAKGSILFTNLEPCCHYGKTPPCTNAIIESGIAAVYCAMKDPNPQVNGKGLKILEDAGIKTRTGFLEDKATFLNKVYIKYITTKIPYVTLKWASSLDGKIATETGESKWITGEVSRKYVHKIRSISDSILAGVGTVIADDPDLTVRHGYRKTLPLVRIIMDEKLQIPRNSKVLRTSKEYPTLIATGKSAAEKYSNEFDPGIKLLTCELNEDGVDPVSLLLSLGKMRITSLLVEGGPKIFASFIKKKLADSIFIILAPRIIGGQSSFSAIASIGYHHLETQSEYRISRFRRLGPDLLLEVYPPGKNICLQA
ncbi:MAG: riboflavin biosynthesis protein RibD [Candidatus Schekmanbacteria bacterium RBG_13_48_7]|uniref:Riboflavin biosynthesis protein RibD n=1 Tax=Candidatus Schekmanbacteria bacterium RBG_13_48_7 TaxID=1817878 RepID=A0A1F7RUY5_9BACT|nr:MAG: riboflavin biosynthesis protein RibD [Candidatus Schekmanbacteria bacterium RBG_13_48_7]